MTHADAAFRLLQEVGSPKHYKWITDELLRRNMIHTSGLTPDATLDARLSTDDRFIRMDDGIYDIAAYETKLLKAIQHSHCALHIQGAYIWHSRSDPGFREAINIDVDAGLACVLAGWCKLSRDQRKNVLRIIEESLQG